MKVLDMLADPEFREALDQFSAAEARGTVLSCKECQEFLYTFLKQFAQHHPGER